MIRLRLEFFLGISIPKIKAIVVPGIRIFNYSFFKLIMPLLSYLTVSVCPILTNPRPIMDSFDVHKLSSMIINYIFY